MVDWRGKEVHVEVLKGVVDFKDDNRSMFLRHGKRLSADSGKVRITNNDPDGRYLSFDKYREGKLGKKTFVETLKVSPDRNRQLQAPFGAFKDDIMITNGRWTEVDPDPKEPGGKTESERKVSGIFDWLKDNWWVAAVLLFLFIIFIFAMTRMRG